MFKELSEWDAFVVIWGKSHLCYTLYNKVISRETFIYATLCAQTILASEY